MLNRTNRTLSALLNRLNLGTRSLDLNASAFNGEQTLRTRHTHAVVMRDGIIGIPRDPMSIGTMRMPSISCSPPVGPQPSERCVVPTQVVFAAEAPPSFDRPVVTSDRPSMPREAQSLSPPRSWRQHADYGRKSFMGKRLYQKTGFANASGRASCAVPAATVAASGE